MCCYNTVALLFTVIVNGRRGGGGAKQTAETQENVGSRAGNGHCAEVRFTVWSSFCVSVPFTRSKNRIM